MASTMFANLVSSYGLKSNGTQAIDVISGIPVKILNTNGTATVYVYVGDKNKAATVISNMQEAAKSMGLAKPRVTGENIIFGFKKPRMAVEEYTNIRQIITNNSASLTNDQCPYCFMGGCDVAGMFKGANARRMHRSCFLNNRNSEMDKIENADGNYITGILGALVAAILIVAFSDALVLGANKIYYILYIMFPLFIAGGFRLGKGPYGTGGTFCHVTISVLAMFAYFYIQGCYYAADWYKIGMLDAAPYVGDILSIILDPEFIKASALEIILFVVGIIVAVVSNPTSKKNGRKTIQQNDVFITPLSTVDTGFTGYDAYNPYANTDTQNFSNAYDAYNTQSTAETQDNNAQNVNNDWRDVYGQNSDNNNNNTFGN